jgi:hypothetical protein
VRASLRSALMRSLSTAAVAACGLPTVLLAAAPATASTVLTNPVLTNPVPTNTVSMKTVSTKDAGPQHSATANVTAEIGYARGLVHPGDQDTMTVSLINHGPQSLDDHTSVHLTVTMPQDTEVAPNVVETIAGDAPAGSSNAKPSTRAIPLTQVFVRSAPGFFDVVVPAGSFGNSVSFRTYTFTLRVSPNVPQGAQLVGGGVAVALENYVGLTVAKSVVPPPPVVVAVSAKPSTRPSTRPPTKPSAPKWTGGSSTRIVSGSPGCHSGGTGGSGQCACPVDQHMSGRSGGTGCSAGALAATGTTSTLPLVLGVSALAAGVVLMRLVRRF